jgi:thioredoxin 1
MSVSEVNDSNFDVEVLQSDVPVLVEFGATWCGPCQRQAPILEQFKSQYDGKVKVVTVDIDESPNASASYGIRSVPSILLFKNGDKLFSKVGLMSLGSIVNEVESSLK